MFDTAVMLLRGGKRDDAAAACWEIIRQQPGHADAWALRARIEAEAGRHANAVMHYQFALKAAPDRFDLWCNCGIDSLAARMHRESEQSFRRSLELQDSFEGHYHYGHLLTAQMRIEEAMQHYEAAIRLNPGNLEAKVNLGQCLITMGKWKEGFNFHRYRFNLPGFPPAPRMNYQQWHGESLDLKTILLFVEQGFGDEIMSFRFAESVSKLASRVIVSARPPMYRLARTLPWADAVILHYDDPPWVPDYQCALLDVPAFIDITPETLPGKTRYFDVADRGFKLTFPEGINVGICWAAGKRELQPDIIEIASAKSLSFKDLSGILAGPGVNLISLQQHHNDADAMRELGVFDPMRGVTDFADTAWIMDQLDLIVTVDTSVAHLAGALGKPVWNLVRHDAIWPWGQETRQTCWYDSMTIYRQSAPFDWSEPLKRLSSDFQALKLNGTWTTERSAA
jgi:tetratricopeptide (TPR) repeat protein